MRDTLRKVDYFHAMIPNTAGQGAKILAGLATLGVNLLAFSAFPAGRRTQFDLVPDDPAQLKRAAKKLGIKLSAKKAGFLVDGGDRIGAMLDIAGTLAGAKINVTAVDAVSTGDGRYGAIFWVKPAQVARTAKLLGAR
jgi:hypothetical protein